MVESHRKSLPTSGLSLREPPSGLHTIMRDARRGECDSFELMRT